MNGKPAFGPDNPHPLATRRTELVWEGKYDEYGNRREVDVAGCAMPMMRIETIDEPPASAIRSAILPETMVLGSWDPGLKDRSCGHWMRRDGSIH